MRCCTESQRQRMTGCPGAIDIILDHVVVAASCQVSDSDPEIPLQGHAGHAVMQPQNCICWQVHELFDCRCVLLLSSAPRLATDWTF